MFALVQCFTLIGTYKTAPLSLWRRCPSSRYLGIAVVGALPQCQMHRLYKNLSVNYINPQRHLTQSDDCRSKVVERQEAAFELFMAHEQLAEAAEPAVADLHPQRLAFLFRRWGGFLRLTTMALSTSSSRLQSCTFAPLTTSDNGTPRPSTSRCRLLPFFSPIGRVGADGLLCQGCFHHGAVNALPAPGDALHLVVLGQAGFPHRFEEAGSFPLEKALVHSACAGRPGRLAQQAVEPAAQRAARSRPLLPRIQLVWTKPCSNAAHPAARSGV